MDKFYKNNTPKTSDMNFLTKNKTKERDVQSESKEFVNKSKEVMNSGKLTKESTVKTDSVFAFSHNIDKQINDLEALIKRLQDEIIDMSNDVEQPLEKDLLEPEASPHHLRINIDENEVDLNKKSHIYSVIINDGGLKSSASNPFSNLKTSEPIKTPSTAELEEAFSNIRRNFSLLWDEVDEDVASQNKDEVEQVEGNMKETLSALKSKVSEIMNYHESRYLLNNPKKNLQ